MPRIFRTPHPKYESSISPIIAVVLILALTIVLAGIFGAFTMGLINPAALTGKIVGVTAESYVSGDEHGVRMTYWGGKDSDQLVSIRAEMGDYGLLTKDGKKELTNFVTGGVYDFNLTASYKTETPNAHTNVTLTTLKNAGELNGQLVNFVGKFTDGTEQVIYTWRITIPAVDIPPGIFYENDYVLVQGFTNESGIPGHGLAVTFKDNRVASVSIPASVTLQDSNNKDKTITFSGQNQKRSYSDKTAYLPADSGTSGFEMLNPSGTASGRLKGEVTVTVEFTKASGLETKSYPVPVVIEERRGLITDTDYIQGEITAYDSGKITAKIMKNGKPTGLTSGNIALGIFYQDGTRENLKTTFTEGGGGTYTITPSSAIGKNVQKIEVYVYSRVDPKKTGNNVNTNVWYVVDSKTISELSSL